MTATDTRPFRTVPNVVGLLFSHGRQEAAAHGVALANPDPDGPPAAALAWPVDRVIVAQEPAAGSRLRQWDSVKIWLQGGPDMGAIPARNPLGADSAEAVPDALPVEVDLTADEEENWGPPPR